LNETIYSISSRLLCGGLSIFDTRLRGHKFSIDDFQLRVEGQNIESFGVAPRFALNGRASQGKQDKY
jgi:hypothetical protein